MDFSTFIKPRAIEVGGRRFYVSKIPAVDAQKIYSDMMAETKPHGNFGLSMLSMELIKRILEYSAVEVGGDKIAITTESQINEYLPELSDVHELLFAMIKENFSFLFDGKLLAQLQTLEKA